MYILSIKNATVSEIFVILFVKWIFFDENIFKHCVYSWSNKYVNLHFVDQTYQAILGSLLNSARLPLYWVSESDHNL